MFELQDRGQGIEVITEDDFLRCLDGKPLDGIDTLAYIGTENLKTSAPQLVPNRIRSVPLTNRPKPEPPKPLKALRRERGITNQVCCADGCSKVAAFRTRSKPAFYAGYVGTHEQLEAVVSQLQSVLIARAPTARRRRTRRTVAS